MKKLTPEQIAEGHKLVNYWFDRITKQCDDTLDKPFEENRARIGLESKTSAECTTNS